MGNYYEGSFCLKLKKEIPEQLVILLKKLQTRNWQEDISLSDQYKDVTDINDSWKEFQFEFGSRYQDEYEDMYIEHTYEESYLEDIMEEAGYVPPISGYYVTVNICTKKYKKDSFDRFLAFIKPYMSDDNEYYLGKIEDENETYQQGYFYDEDKAKLCMKARIAFCEGCEFLKDLIPCGYEPLCRRAYEKGKGETNVR